jgi:glycosyltransferase involved in cell wall biosynthesis
MVQVSVITPTYNREETLPRTIESVLNQTYDKFEYIIVDDASTDKTEEVVRSYKDSRINYIKHETNLRQGAARNTGIQHANGDYVAFIDSDDEWREKKLENQVAELEERSRDWVGVYCDSTTKRNSKIKNIITDLFSYEIRTEGGEELIKDILAMQGNISAGSSLVARTTVARDIGGFDEALPRHEDLDFVLRLLKQSKLAYIDKPLVIVHESPDPPAVLVERSKDLLLNKFRKDILEIENMGYPVRKYHRFHLGRCYVKEGRFIKGIGYLAGSKASNPRQYFRLFVALVQGIKNKLYLSNRRQVNS